MLPDSSEALRPHPGLGLGDRSFAMLDGLTIVTRHPGPALLIDGEGRIVIATPAALALCAAYQSETEAGNVFRRMLVEARQLKSSIVSEITLPQADDPSGLVLRFDLLIMPCHASNQDDPGVLVVAREKTLEHNFARALVASRALFKDLVSCSSDFAWETDREGVLTFVSERGSLGYNADTIHGQRADDLIDETKTPPHHFYGRGSPFVTGAPVEDVQVWLKGADGHSLCFLMSAVPVFDEAGLWRGARGIGRDVTALQQREGELSRARSREELSRTILDATLSEANFTDMLAAAARATALATKSERAWVLLSEASEGYDIGAAFGMVPYGARQFLPPTLAEPVLTASGLAAFEHDGWRYLGAPTVLRGKPNGGICIARPFEGAMFDEETTALIELVARHTAIAIAQASNLRELTNLTRSDELTGLANRRALGETYARWQKQKPTRQSLGALLFIDLDNFKQINDLAGHAAGDAMLQKFARLLGRDSRRRDLAVRIGGDEFAVWMANVTEGGALARAHRIIEAARDIPLPVRDKNSCLGLSVGVAIVKTGSTETLDCLLDRADRALYQAKLAGKGCATLAGQLLGDGSGENPC